MKKLNEVIKASECCNHGEPDSRCEDCPYNGIGACCAEREFDALHYLKEYLAILPLVPSLINTAIEMQKKGKTIG